MTHTITLDLARLAERNTQEYRINTVRDECDALNEFEDALREYRKVSEAV